MVFRPAALEKKNRIQVLGHDRNRLFTVPRGRGILTMMDYVTLSVGNKTKAVRRHQAASRILKR